MSRTYPDSNLLDEAKVKVREVQEVLAEGVYKVGDFYYLHKSYPAAIDRYKEVLIKYPDSSQVPDALFKLAEALRHSDNEPDAAIYYARIVSDHPLSERVTEAKQRLTAMNVPVPEPNPVALARAQQNQRDDRSILGRMFGMFNRRPPVSAETGAASSATPEEPAADEDTGAFSIDPKVIQPGQQQSQPH